jgi:hypothetical protein
MMTIEELMTELDARISAGYVVLNKVLQEPNGDTTYIKYGITILENLQALIKGEK